MGATGVPVNPAREGREVSRAKPSSAVKASRAIKVKRASEVNEVRSARGRNMNGTTRDSVSRKPTGRGGNMWTSRDRPVRLALRVAWFKLWVAVAGLAHKVRRAHRVHREQAREPETDISRWAGEKDEMEILFKGTQDEFNATFRLPLADWHTEVLSLLNEMEQRITTMAETVQTLSKKLDDAEAAAATEKQEVTNRLAEVDAQVLALNDQIAALKVGAVTQEQLDALGTRVDKVHQGIVGIFTPTGEPPIEVPPVE